MGGGGGGSSGIGCTPGEVSGGGGWEEREARGVRGVRGGVRGCENGWGLHKDEEDEGLGGMEESGSGTRALRAELRVVTMWGLLVELRDGGKKYGREGREGGGGVRKTGKDKGMCWIR